MHMMQFIRYNPHNSNDAILAIQSQSQSAYLHDGHNGHDGYNGMAMAIMTKIRFMMLITATEAMITTWSLWL